MLIRGTWEVEAGSPSQNEESLNSGIEGEWKLHGEAEAGTREFAMRQWGETGGGSGEPVSGEWRLEYYTTRTSGKILDDKTHFLFFLFNFDW